MNGIHETSNVPPLQRLVQLCIARYFWGVLFWFSRVQLTEHREKVNEKISRIPLNVLPLRLLRYLKQGVILLEHAFYEVRQFENIYKDFRPFDLYNRNNNYYAPCYFTVDGHFDDVAWVRRFIKDEENYIVYRFRFACCYCLESDIFTLWKEIKEAGLVRPNWDISPLFVFSHKLVAHWIAKLDNKLYYYINEYINVYVDEYIHERIQVYKADEINIYNKINWHEKVWYLVSFLEAVVNGNEKATYYYWQHLPNTEKDALIQRKKLYFVMERASESNYFKIVYFLYNQLSEEQKHDLFYWTSNNKYKPSVWCCLLESPFTHSAIFHEIIQSPFVISFEVQVLLISYITDKFIELKLSILKKAIFILWKKLPKAKQLSVLVKEILIREVYAKHFDIVDIIVRGMSFEQKKEYIHYEIEEVILSLDIMSSFGQYGLLQQYLSFFLVHEDKTRNEIFRKDVMLLLDNFMQSSQFKEWLQNLPEKDKIEVNKVTDALQNSVAVMNQVLSLLD